jgi:hypothetical protein
MKKVLAPYPGLYNQFLEFHPADQQENSLPEQKEEELSQEGRNSEESVAEKNGVAGSVKELEIQAKLNGILDDEEVIDILKDTIKTNTPIYKEIMKCLSLYSVVM